MKTIELSKFKTTESEWGGTEPFSIAFVYSSKGNFVVKGMCSEVDKYVDEHFPQSVLNMTYWKNGKSHNFWKSPPTCPVYFHPIRCGMRIKTKILMSTSDGMETVAIVRKIPKRFLPAYRRACRV